ncbi:reverse transcriptase, partial [Lasius niger]
MIQFSNMDGSGGGSQLTKSSILSSYTGTLDLSDENTTTINVEGSSGKIMFTAAYLSHDADIPTEAVRKLVMLSDRFIIGADANARHTCWGSTGIN